MPVIDFSTVKTLKQIPDGWHSGSTIVKATEGVLSKKGNPQTQLQWELGPDDEDAAGRKVLDHLMEEPSNDGFWRTLIVLQAIGIIPEDVDLNDADAVHALGSLEWSADDLIGATADIKTELQEYEGRWNAKVVGVRAPRPTMESALS